MGFLNRYGEYLRDNPQGYWFKRKAYGWGWVPSRWQGWASLAVFIALFVWFFVSFLQDPTPTNADVARFIGRVVAWVLALMALCVLTGEPPKWQWGIPDKE